ncbi:ribonuclease III [Ahrensia kielensis]|uniref:ribonuclease III n=1 Tax=Ahrensia kielensis TaxID=76980 RepID=UPI00035F98E2|nr:ribonuclease III [Ahrensia kielensis]
MTNNAPAGTVSSQKLEKLEELTGHKFKDIVRLDRALTHSSAQHRTGKDYERLEFLGDRVLGLCIAEMLFARFAEANEGELSVRLNALVNAETLAEIADELKLHEVIRTGADVRDLQSERQKNMRADVVESLIATIYLDGGIPAARQFINRYWEPRAAHVAAARRDAKTELQEWSHKYHETVPAYTEISREGPDHEPVFVIEVKVGKLKAERAEGRSKRLAEQAAAEKLLRREAVWKPETKGVSK